MEAAGQVRRALASYRIPGATMHTAAVVLPIRSYEFFVVLNGRGLPVALCEQPLHLAINLLHPPVQRSELIIASANENARDGCGEDPDDSDPDHHQDHRDDP